MRANITFISLTITILLNLLFITSVYSSSQINLLQHFPQKYWRALGNANWKKEKDFIQANKGIGYLVTKKSFDNFELRLEFWADLNSNSGVFLRCQNPKLITDKNCYEVNIFDKRPDQTGRTGGIVNIAPSQSKIDTEGKWNTYEIKAVNDHLVIKLNGVKTVDIKHRNFKKGPIALQFVQGRIKFKNIVIKEH